MIFFRYLLTLLLVSTLTGCSTTKDELLPPGDKTMLDQWRYKAGGSGVMAEARSLLRRGVTDRDQKQRVILEESYTRTAENEIQQLFPRLPNPDMVMYVYPHLAGKEPVPVPGYSTVFAFYSRVHYALPGERLEAL
ncbi:TIGR03751 family conjugal transfer lipoprotein [Enterobacter bugandensis]|nr:TIGR03751 family conjugal transfer lipoprotein [Enterobacter bugandensis]EKS7120203.1 TIGR03751 family conjugal transfer lipoprotein [Enterobacter bugandensis]